MLISPQCLGMLVGVFRPLLWSQTASPASVGVRSGIVFSVQSPVPEAVLSQGRLCAAPMLGLPLRACQTPGRGFRGQRGCSGWSLAAAPLLTSGRPLPNQPAPLSGTQCQGSCQIHEANQASQSLEVPLPLPCTPGPLAGCLRGRNVCAPGLPGIWTGWRSSDVQGARDAGCGCGAWWGAGWHPLWGALCP